MALYYPQHLLSITTDLWILADYTAQAAQEDPSSGDFEYTPRTTCFADYLPNGAVPCYKGDLKKSRAQFIFESCLGFDYREGLSQSYDADELDDSVTEMKALVEDLARKLTFDMSAIPKLADQLKQAGDDVCNSDGNGCTDNANVCVEMKGCYIAEVNKLLENGESEIFAELKDVDDYDFTGDAIVSSEFMYSQCWNETYADLLDKKEAVCSSSVSTTRTTEIRDGDGGCESLPVCPVDLASQFLSYTPDYPQDSGSYGVGVASIKGLYFTQLDGQPK